MHTCVIHLTTPYIFILVDIIYNVFIMHTHQFNGKNNFMICKITQDHIEVTRDNNVTTGRQNDVTEGTIKHNSYGYVNMVYDSIAMSIR